MGKMFGTDGIRGIANQELTCELAMKVGAAGAYVLASAVHTPRILIGSDTRKSGGMLAAALSAGICSVGGDVIDLGIIPTPAMAYLVRLYEADAAVMISASHNTMEYNGIKWFDENGFKLKDEIENKIETIVNENIELLRPVGAGVGRIIKAKQARDEYREFLQSKAEEDFSGLKIVVDCANGAASHIAKETFVALGANVLSFDSEPDGYNINDQCGSTHPARLQKLVIELGADVGFAFDGDADRVIASDERGNLVDGDRIMGICALSFKKDGKLKNDSIVLTVMSNLGLKQKLKENGIAMSETTVGDRYVLEKMMETGDILGGEQSGHIIFLEHNTTGDGILSAIQLLNVLKRSGKKMSALAKEIPIYPQVIANVTVQDDQKAQILKDAGLAKMMKEAENKLKDTGRVFIRASGTEPLIRIMLEGKSEEEISLMAIDFAKYIETNYQGKIKH